MPVRWSVNLIAGDWSLAFWAVDELANVACLELAWLLLRAAGMVVEAEQKEEVDKEWV